MYYISPRLASELAKKSNQKLRNALRMWFWLKTNDYQSTFYAKDIRPILKSAGFHTNQQKKYFFILHSAGYLGRDRWGKIFLRGGFILFKDQPASRSGKRKIYQVLPEHTSTQDMWMSFLSACQTVYIQDKVQKYTCKHLVASASTPLMAPNSNFGEDSASRNKETAVSTQILSQTLGVSTATASRIRTRAAKKGFISNRLVLIDKTSSLPEVKTFRCLLRVKAELQEALPSTWRQERDIIKYGKGDVINPSALIFSRGQVLMQKPNMVRNILIVKGTAIR